MAGHSKWANIKHRKGRQDAKKAKVFTKLARAITVAVKEGGDDSEYNTDLANAIEKAKAENMPNDNIDRAIKKGSGDLDGANYEEITYEGYGPNGVAVMVQCLTDNKNRTAADVRHYFSKYNGNLGATGCVSFMFDRKGVFIIERTEDTDEEELMIQTIEAGAEDFRAEDEYFEITTAPEDFKDVRDALKAEGYKFATAEVTFVPQNETKLDEEKDIKTMAKLIDALEDNDDVQEVYHNWDMPSDLDE
ncbi:YebC/PmpR family DNA-binding transcriptional regulator [Clostridium sp. D2Q-11]|uniref:Probable transcriptional regulatory protein GOQ27_14290 n=1 Tax=Anaeromonas frigoriresistens TaxID=2683708 RepID=A0A942UWZ9_9FIRM|nr:YebC/PmpR family DNA-binding transcriptional regulator [Anaeromonas frigoriresistens]MBS4539640.1 YebC/PmpR family DNA-binding transcriptional regulator [Anaeromonas frigoriresistens]